jgi:hypothetical protein
MISNLFALSQLGFKLGFKDVSGKNPSCHGEKRPGQPIEVIDIGTR